MLMIVSSFSWIRISKVNALNIYLSSANPEIDMIIPTLDEINYSY